MGNVKKDTMNIKEESRQLHELLKIIFQEEEGKVELQKEQLNTRFMSLYNSSKHKLRRDDNGGQQSAVPPIDSLRSGKTPLFAAAAAGNSMWSQKAQSAVLHEFKAELEKAKRAEDELALWHKTNPDLLSSMNSLEKYFGVLKSAHLEKETSVAMLLGVSTTTDKFWEQFGKGDVMLGSRRFPIYVEARCSQIDELRVTPEVTVQFATKQFDQERSLTLWRELVHESPAINSVLDRVSVTANNLVVSEGGKRNVKFRIAMLAESDPNSNSPLKGLKNATVVSESSNSEKNIVEVAVHQGVSISVEGFLFEANTNLPALNNNIEMLNDNERQRMLRDSLAWFHLSIENCKEAYNHETIHNVLRGLSLNIQSTHSLQNNNVTLNYDNSCDTYRRLCSGVTQISEMVTQIPEVALGDCSASTPQRDIGPIPVCSMSVTHHHSHLQEHFKYTEV